MANSDLSDYETIIKKENHITINNNNNKNGNYVDKMSILESSVDNDYVQIRANDVLNEMIIDDQTTTGAIKSVTNKQLNDRNTFREKEEELKRKYYKSNPLKLYAPTKGQPFLPPRFHHDEIEIFDINRKKSLPKVYQELRTTENVQEDRELHKQKMRATLKLNLNSVEQQRNPIDLIENSKKIYTEYCRYNLSKPIDISNVESILKQNLKINHNSQSAFEHDINRQESTYEGFNNSSDMDSSRSLLLNEKHSKSANNKKSRSAELLIDAQTVAIKGLDEISREIKNRKIKLARLNYDSEKDTNNKYNYRTIKSGTNEPHKGSIYNYRQAVKTTYIKNKPVKEDDEPFEDESLERIMTQIKNNYNLKLLKNKIDDEPQDPIHNSIADENINDSPLNSSNEIVTRSNLVYSNALSPDAKYKLRIKQAREKILNDQVERTNLNKMTILQPFEDTKILINIDKVPSKLLNSLLNKQSHAPRYYIPPIRAFGYLKKVNVNPSSITVGSSSGELISSLSNNHINPSNKSISPTNQSRKNSQRSIKFESIKSLSENNQLGNLFGNTNKERTEENLNISNNNNTTSTSNDVKVGSANRRSIQT